jgi:hypothetical protein
MRWCFRATVNAPTTVSSGLHIMEQPIPAHMAFDLAPVFAGGWGGGMGGSSSGSGSGGAARRLAGDQCHSMQHFERFWLLYTMAMVRPQASW